MAAAPKPLLPSLWAATAPTAQVFPPFEGEARADVAVIGGGFTGLSVALHLAERATSVVLLEAAEPGWGASGRSGGQVIPGLKYDPDELTGTFGPNLGPRLVRAVGGATDLVFELIGRHGLAMRTLMGKLFVARAFGKGQAESLSRSR
jgi:glycine/D-amino acid oxidase-like deaminating enzyme